MFGANKAAGGLYQPQSGAVPVTPSGGGAGGMGLEDDQMERLLEHLGTLPPEEREAFMQSMFADYAGEENMVERQRATADELRQTPLAEGTQGRAGYTAANPLVHYNVSRDRRQGRQEAAQAEAAMQAMSEKRAAAQRQMVDALTATRR